MTPCLCSRRPCTSLASACWPTSCSRSGTAEVGRGPAAARPPAAAWPLPLRRPTALSWRAGRPSGPSGWALNSLSDLALAPVPFPSSRPLAAHAGAHRGLPAGQAVLQLHDGVRHPHAAGLPHPGSHRLGHLLAARPAEGVVPGRPGCHEPPLCRGALLRARAGSAPHHPPLLVLQGGCRGRGGGRWTA